MRVNLERWQRKKGFVCLCKRRPTFFELATTLKNLGAKWLSEKKINFTPCNTIRHFLKANTIQKCMSSLTQQNIQPGHEVWRWEHCLDCLWSCESKKKRIFHHIFITYNHLNFIHVKLNPHSGGEEGSMLQKP